MALKIATKKGLKAALKNRGLKLPHGYSVKKRKAKPKKRKR